MNYNRDHLKEVDMTYWQHMRFAASIALQLLVGSTLFLVHGFVPFVQFDRYNLEEISKYLRNIHDKREEPK